MKETDILLALGQAGKPLGALEIAEGVARMKNYGKLRALLFCNPGSMYPELARLEKQNFITGEFQPGPYPSRRLYQLTMNGIAWYAAQRGLL